MNLTLVQESIAASASRSAARDERRTIANLARRHLANAITSLRLIGAAAVAVVLAVALGGLLPAWGSMPTHAMDLALWTIAAAVLLDGLDGSLARRLNAVSRAGARLDAAADFVGFAAAPPLLAWLALRDPLERVSGQAPLAAALFGGAIVIYVAASAVRLARFRDAARVCGAAVRTFRGLPTPAAAVGLAALAALAREMSDFGAVISGVWVLVLLGGLMVSHTRFIHLGDAWAALGERGGAAALAIAAGLAAALHMMIGVGGVLAVAAGAYVVLGRRTSAGAGAAVAETS